MEDKRTMDGKKKKSQQQNITPTAAETHAAAYVYACRCPVGFILGGSTRGNICPLFNACVNTARKRIEF